MSHLNKIAKPIGTYYRDDQIVKMDNVLYKYIAKMVYDDEEIEPQKTYLISIPLTTDTFVYDGTVKTPTWVGFDSSIMAASGDTSATNAGEHTVTFTFIDNRYSWLDGTNTPKQVTWSIEQADDAITFYIDNPATVEINFQRWMDAGSLSGTDLVVDKSGYDHSIAEVSQVSGVNFMIDGYQEGTVDVLFTVNDPNGNYKPASAILTVNVIPSKTYLSHFTVPNTATSFGINKLT